MLGRATSSGEARVALAEPSSVRDVIERLRTASPSIIARLPDLDARGAFPAEDIALLRSVGALEVFATGATAPLELMEALRLLGRSNLSLGRIFEGHVNGALLVERYGTLFQRRQLAADLAAGRVYGVWNTEPAPVRIVGQGDHQNLDGLKSYATGAGHIDRAIVTGLAPGGERQMIIVSADDLARADGSVWRVRGMKATVSGTYDLNGLPVTEQTRLGGPGGYEREPQFSAGAWRFAAVQLGGVERVLTLLREHLTASAAGRDPIHRARFGKAYAATRTAYLWVREAAIKAQARNAGADAIALVMLTRGLVENAGFEVMEASARSVGTRAYFADHPLDVACRDLALYLRQPVPDQALDRGAGAALATDIWSEDPLW